MSRFLGLRNDSHDEIEKVIFYFLSFVIKEGIEGSLEVIKKADCLLLLLDVSNSCDYFTDLIPWNELGNKPIFIVCNKIDIFHNQAQIDLLISKVKLLASTSSQVIPAYTSCTKNIGIDNLLKQIAKLLEEAFVSHINTTTLKTLADSHSNILMMTDRHMQHLRECIYYLEMFIIWDPQNQDVAMAAEFLRLSLNELGKITGKVNVESILSIILERFCIGK